MLKKYKYVTADGYINTVFRLMSKEHADEAYIQQKRMNNSFIRGSAQAKVELPDAFKRRATLMDDEWT